MVLRYENKIKKTPNKIPKRGTNFLRLFYSLKIIPPATTAIKI